MSELYLYQLAKAPDMDRRELTRTCKQNESG